jgi:ribosomal protein S18 acetylase RimI-like enzyme
MAAGKPRTRGAFLCRQKTYDAAMTDVLFRPALKHESRRIAELYRISSDGVADYIWSGLRESGDDLLDVGARRYARENTDFSYQNVTVAVIGDEIVGMLAGYALGPPEQPGDEFDFDIDPVLRPYHQLELPNSFYISGMALFPRFRSRGIGTQLLALAVEQARKRDLRQLSLIVFEQNTGARRLYERVGFRELMRAAVVPHRLIRYGGDALLLAKDV